MIAIETYLLVIIIIFFNKSYRTQKIVEQIFFYKNLKLSASTYNQLNFCLEWILFMRSPNRFSIRYDYSKLWIRVSYYYRRKFSVLVKDFMVS